MLQISSAILSEESCQGLRDMFDEADHAMASYHTINNVDDNPIDGILSFSVRSIVDVFSDGPLCRIKTMIHPLAYLECTSYILEKLLDMTASMMARITNNTRGTPRNRKQFKRISAKKSRDTSAIMEKLGQDMMIKLREEYPEKDLPIELPEKVIDQMHYHDLGFLENSSDMDYLVFLADEMRKAILKTEMKPEDNENNAQEVSDVKLEFNDRDRNYKPVQGEFVNMNEVYEEPLENTEAFITDVCSAYFPEYYESTEPSSKSNEVPVNEALLGYMDYDKDLDSNEPPSPISMSVTA